MAWETATPERLGAPHRHTVAVSLETRNGAITAVDALHDGGLTVTFDETTAPYVTATATMPATDSAVDLADPLGFTHLNITAGYQWDDGTVDQDVLARLPLVSRRTARPADHVQVTAASLEALALQYHVKFQPGAGGLPGDHEQTFAQLYGTLVGYLVNGSFLTIPTNWPTEWTDRPLADLYTGAGTDFYSFRVNAGDNLWTVLDDLGATFGGRRIYGDNLGRWAGRMAGTPDRTDTFMRLAPGLNLVTSEATVGYTDYYNTVVDHYEYRFGDTDTEVFARASLTSGPYSVLNSPERVKYTRRNQYIGQARADAAAARRVRTLAARRNLITVEAVANYRLRPKHLIDLQLPSWPASEPWIVQAVTFTPGTGRMKLTLRRPIDDAATIDATGE